MSYILFRFPDHRPNVWPLSLDLESKKEVQKCLAGDIVMGKKLYVGNMGYGVDSSALEEMFKDFGNVESAQVITDRDTGRSKGFGFVEMSSDSEAKAAIDALNGKEVDGRALTVNEAKPREDRPRSFGGGSRR
jgi:RNA recognition motif-containing protein